MQSLGFVVGKADHSLFTKKTDAGLVVLVIYVDGLIITGDDDTGIQNVMAVLKTKFDMKDLGEMKFFLCIEVVNLAHGLCLMQR